MCSALNSALSCNQAAIKLLCMPSWMCVYCASSAPHPLPRAIDKRTAPPACCLKAVRSQLAQLSKKLEAAAAAAAQVPVEAGDPYDRCDAGSGGEAAPQQQGSSSGASEDEEGNQQQKVRRMAPITYVTTFWIFPSLEGSVILRW